MYNISFWRQALSRTSKFSIVCLSEHCTCHFKGECLGRVMKPVLCVEVRSEWEGEMVAGYYQIGGNHMVDEKRWWKFFGKHMAR
jgi:hypothetical protein